MFTPQSAFDITGEIDGIHVLVHVDVQSESADASNRISPKRHSVTDVHNVGTMLLIAVNNVLRILQEQSLGLPPLPPTMTVLPSRGGNNVLDFHHALDDSIDPERKPS